MFENLPAIPISGTNTGLETPQIYPLTNLTRILRLKGKISLLASGMSPKNFSVYQRSKTQTKLTLELAILQSIAALVDVGSMESFSVLSTSFFRKSIATVFSEEIV
jgi:hypothetical protein